MNKVVVGSLITIWCVVTLLILSGCGSSTKLVDKPTIVERTPYEAPVIPSASLNRFEWTISSPTLWCVAPEGYKAIMNNEKVSRDQIIRRNDVIDGYKKYYAPTSVTPSQ